MCAGGGGGGRCEWDFYRSMTLNQARELGKGTRQGDEEGTRQGGWRKETKARRQDKGNKARRMRQEDKAMGTRQGK